MMIRKTGLLLKSSRMLPLTAIIVSLSLLSCEESFSPKGPFEEKLVVFGILDPQSEIQVIRVQHTYDTPGYSAFENETDPRVDDALVTVTVDDTPYVFRDTVFTRDSNTRYKDDVHAYYSQDLKVAKNKTYALKVESTRYGTVTSTCRAPGNLAIIATWDSTGGGRDPEGQLPVNVIAEGVKGYLIRAFQIWFEIANGEIVNQGEEEIPVGYSKNPDGADQPAYPEAGRSHLFIFDGRIIKRVQAELRKNPDHTYIFYNVRVSATVLDYNLYNYFNIVRGFNDSNSVRVDEPDWTNIIGGYGVFGAMASRSVTVRLK